MTYATYIKTYYNVLIINQLHIRGFLGDFRGYNRF
jgi:hypothetical protein